MTPNPRDFLALKNFNYIFILPYCKSKKKYKVTNNVFFSLVPMNYVERDNTKI